MPLLGSGWRVGKMNFSLGHLSPQELQSKNDSFRRTSRWEEPWSQEKKVMGAKARQDGGRKAAPQGTVCFQLHWAGPWEILGKEDTWGILDSAGWPHFLGVFLNWDVGDALPRQRVSREETRPEHNQLGSSCRQDEGIWKSRAAKSSNRDKQSSGGAEDAGHLNTTHHSHKISAGKGSDGSYSFSIRNYFTESQDGLGWKGP